MPQRNIDRIQDEWAARGRYSRQPSPETQRLLDEMFPPVRHVRTPGGYASGYLEDMTERIIGAVRDEALTRPEIAARLGLSPKYIAKALAAIVESGQLTRNAAAPGRVCRYWKPQVAAEAA